MSLKQKKILLHIGLYKTGSTFLQDSLKKVKNNNFQIFLPGSKMVKHVLNYLDDPNEIIRKKILKIINKSNKNLFISSEVIFGHQSNGFKDASTRLKFLEQLFNKPNYIIFFREPSEIIYSGFSQGLKKNINLKFKNYINKNIDDLFETIPKNFSQMTNYKIFDYNNIFSDYLNIQRRVEFFEYKKFFIEKNEDDLNYFKILIEDFNFKRKVNKSFKSLIYLEFYSRFLLFKCIKILWLRFNKLFFRCKREDEPYRLSVLINLLCKITPKKYLKKIEDENEILLKQIKNYHSKNYKKFINKLKPTKRIPLN